MAEAADTARRSPSGSGAIDEGALLKAADGTRRNLSGSAQRVAAGKSMQRRRGPGGALSSSCGRVLGWASCPCWRLGSHHTWSEVSVFVMTGRIVCGARSLTVGRQRAARGEAGERASAGKSSRRRGRPGRAWPASSGIVCGDRKRSWREARAAMFAVAMDARCCAGLVGVVCLGSNNEHHASYHAFVVVKRGVNSHKKGRADEKEIPCSKFAKQAGKSSKKSSTFRPGFLRFVVKIFEIGGKIFEITRLVQIDPPGGVKGDGFT